MDMETLAEKIKAVIGDMPVYLTFDIDALDPWQRLEPVLLSLAALPQHR